MKKNCHICGQNEGIKSSWISMGTYHEYYACQQCRDAILFKIPIRQLIKYYEEIENETIQNNN